MDKKELLGKVKKAAEVVAPAVQEMVSNAKDYAVEKAIPAAKEFASEAKEFTEERAIPMAKETATSVKEGAVKVAHVVEDKALDTFDVNGDGKFDFHDILILALRIPGVRIDRDEFLRKSFMKERNQDTIDRAISETPAKAGIKLDLVDKVVDDVIEYERNCVTAMSTGLGVVPGGVGIAISTGVADIVQYYGFMLRVAQKLMYLYGFPQVDFENDDQPVDDGTMNMLMLCLGAMNGIQEAALAMKSLAKGIGNGVSKVILKKALTKGTLYPIIKKVWTFMGAKMTKTILAEGLKKSILIAGGVLAGGITFISFQKCCENFKDSIHDTILSNPDGHIDDSAVIDVEFEAE